MSKSTAKDVVQVFEEVQSGEWLIGNLHKTGTNSEEEWSAEASDEFSEISNPDFVISAERMVFIEDVYRKTPQEIILLILDNGGAVFTDTRILYINPKISQLNHEANNA